MHVRPAQRILRLCRNKPLFLVDRGPWNPRAFVQLGLRFRHMTFGLRGRIEQWFSQMKERTKRFYNSPYGSNLKIVRTYFAIHTTTHNLLMDLT